MVRTTKLKTAAFKIQLRFTFKLKKTTNLKVVTQKLCTVLNCNKSKLKDQESKLLFFKLYQIFNKNILQCIYKKNIAIKI